MGIFNLGKMIGAFGGTPKYESIFKPYDPDVRRENVSQINSMERDRGLDDEAFAKYRSALATLEPEYRATARRGSDLLTALSQQGNDPYGGYERLRKGNLEAFTPFLNYTANAGLKRSNLMSSMRGGGNTTPYYAHENASRAGSALSPVLSQIFGNLGRDTSMLEESRLRDTAQRSMLPEKALRILREGEGLPLSEVEARGNQRARYAALLSALEGISKSNSARGMQRKKTTLDKFAQFGDAADEGLNSALDTVMSLYGGGGGGLGGLFGGGGGEKKSSGGSSRNFEPDWV